MLATLVNICLPSHCPDILDSGDSLVHFSWQGHHRLPGRLYSITKMVLAVFLGGHRLVGSSFIESFIQIIGKMGK